MVSGNDDFLSGSTSNQDKDSVLDQEKGEKMPHEKIKAELSSSEIRYVRGDSFTNEEKSSGRKKTRKRLTKEANDASTSRENSLIW